MAKGPTSTSFKPGISGNPRGRPKKGTTLTDILVKELRKKNIGVKGGPTISGKEAAVKKLIHLALVDDNERCLLYIFDRLDGKPDTTIRFDPREMPLIEVGYDLPDSPESEKEPGEGVDDDN